MVTSRPLFLFLAFEGLHIPSCVDSRFLLVSSCTDGDEYLEAIGFDELTLSENGIVLAMYTVGMFILGYLALRFLKWEKR